MADYLWKPSLMRRVFVLPKEIADRHLRLCSFIQLKVLLWVSRNSGVFDVEACAKAIGESVPDCQDALQYWVAVKVLHPGEESAAVSEPKASPVKTEVAEPPKKPEVPKRLKVEKPQMIQVIRRQKSDEEFGGLLTEVGARIGRPLSNGDAETLLYLYETVGLPAAVILMVVGYAAQVEHLTMRYIEKVALDWSERGIMTMEAAEEHLCYLERCEQAVLRVQAVCRLPKPLTGATAMRAAEKWICQWQITDEVLAQAFAVCVEKIGKFEVRYIDRVLENWRNQGADTEEKVAALSAKSTKGKPSTVENTEYENMVEQYVPVYKKKTR